MPKIKDWYAPRRWVKFLTRESSLEWGIEDKVVYKKVKKAKKYCIYIYALFHFLLFVFCKQQKKKALLLTYANKKYIFLILRGITAIHCPERVAQPESLDVFWRLCAHINWFTHIISQGSFNHHPRMDTSTGDCLTLSLVRHYIMIMVWYLCHYKPWLADPITNTFPVRLKRTASGASISSIFFSFQPWEMFWFCLC